MIKMLIGIYIVEFIVARMYPLLLCQMLVEREEVAVLVVNGSVVDITSFASHHPGGDGLLLDAVGQDATREFETVAHSQSAMRLFDNLVLWSSTEFLSSLLFLILISFFYLSFFW